MVYDYGDLDADRIEERAARHIRDSIITNRMPPGMVINQSALARELGISRIPLRQALRILVAEGLVRMEASGALVAPVAIRDLEEIYEIREAIEPMAMRLALPKVGRAQVMQMENWLDRMRRANDHFAWLSANRSFHRAVYAQSDRPRMIELIDNLAVQTDRYLWLHFTARHDRLDAEMDEFDGQHQMILDAVQRGNIGEIEELTKLHLVTAHSAVLRRLLALGDDSVQRAEPVSGRAAA